MNKLLFTKLRQKTAAVLVSESRALQIEFAPENEGLQPGMILVGKVKNIVKNLNAAFVECMPGVNGYYSLTENTDHLFADGRTGGPLRNGDDIIVQVSRAASKSKEAMLTSDLSLTGRYSVLTRSKSFGISAKIRDNAWREQMRELWESREDKPYGVIVRTNAYTAAPELVFAEIERLSGELSHLIRIATSRTCYSVLHKPEQFAGRTVRDTYTSNLVEIVTDLPEIYEELMTDSLNLPEVPLRFYKDSYPLTALYHLESSLDHALSRHVWLKSGGTLVIEPTEAMTVIDVNSAKTVAHKSPAELHLQTNLEAAEEIAVQLRLRNLSGIIVIDFIDMKGPDDSERLMKRFGAALSADPVRTVLVDMTPLGLIEVTRKKIRQPLYEQVKRLGILKAGE